MSVFTLPIPLILLVHLHILEYPHANKPEYDHNVFEPRVRGLKERTKLLEDITYFLVGRLEGGAKSILATYPCVAPSDTLAFRTSLSKYIETLRHNSVYPTSKGAISGPKPKGKEQVRVAAWWWKDVVVRKSLLEECAGERFERLLLSVSTHVLLKGSAAISARIDLDNLNTILRSQPTAYAELLRKCKAGRHAWAQSALILLQREADLHVLRPTLTTVQERLNRQGGQIVSKYSKIPTDRFLLVVSSKRSDLLRVSWPGPDGTLALDFLTKAAGIERPAICAELLSESASASPSLPATQPQQKPTAPAPVQPLPIAAAHHPAYLKKIRKPVFSSGRPQPTKPGLSQAAANELKPSRRTAMALSERYEAEARTQRALVETLGKIKRVGRDLAERAQVLERKRLAKASGKSVPPPRKHEVLGLDLWEPEVLVPVDFETKPTPELLASFLLNTDESEGGLEARIDEIRDTLLPAYPPLPDLNAPRLPHPDPEPKAGSSRIPRMGMAASSVQAQTSTLVRGGEKKGTRKGKAAAQKQKQKPKPRKSIRVSLAAQAQRRPSLFAPPPASEPEDDNIHQMIHGVQDVSTELDGAPDVLYPMSPITKTPGTVKVNRIFTGSRGGSTLRRPPKQSFPGVFMEPAVPLPSLVAASESFEGMGGWMSDDDADEDLGLGLEAGGDGEGEGYQGDGSSMTLKDILLSADTTDFALMGEGEEVDEIGDESFNWE
ncbi:hypothetical protein DXG01_013503 [Tephrocybe rancida]|nr:hypothetical protein DXG01_013503 [Tephrocybe rancida]